MTMGIWGRKIGMTQVFTENKVMPVTVVDVAHWFVTGVRNKARDGHDAVQVGCLRKKYENQPFSSLWLKRPKQYFQYVREVKMDQEADTSMVGQSVDFYNNFNPGQMVDVVGWSKGCGFAGVYKRHGFGGAPKSHGGMMGRRPGSIGGLRTSGRVIKGKRMAGHMGVERVVVRQLRVINVNVDDKAIVVKGAVPGKTGSLVFIRKV